MVTTMSERVVIIGAGGHGREVRDWFLHWAAEQRSQWEFVGFLADPKPDMAKLGRLGADYLGPVSGLADMPNVRYYVGIGDTGHRERIANMVDGVGATAGPPIVHPSAIIGSDVEFGDGTVVCPGVVVTTNVRVGRHAHLNFTATVAHDAIIEDFVTVGPGATISGNVTLSRGVYIGTNSAVKERLHVGAHSIVGAGAAVVEDIPPGVVAVGVPARPRS